MNATIKALTPDLATTLTSFLESVDFSYSPAWATCFCRYYYTLCSMSEWMSRSGEFNKRESMEAIKQGDMNGYLAYENDKVIGWYNAPDVSKLVRLDPEVKKLRQNQKFGCTICFVIHPEYRGLGVATALLQHAIDDLKQKGYDGMLALPFEVFGNKQKEYRGPYTLYERLGYVTIEQDDERRLMRLLFRKDK